MLSSRQKNNEVLLYCRNWSVYGDQPIRISQASCTTYTPQPIQIITTNCRTTPSKVAQDPTIYKYYTLSLRNFSLAPPSCTFTKHILNSAYMYSYSRTIFVFLQALGWGDGSECQTWGRTFNGPKGALRTSNGTVINLVIIVLERVQPEPIYCTWDGLTPPPPIASFFRSGFAQWSFLACLLFFCCFAPLFACYR